MNIRTATVSPADAEVDLLVLGLPKDYADTLASLLGSGASAVADWLARKKFKGGAAESVVFPSFGRVKATQVGIVGIGSGSAAELATAAGVAGQLARAERATSLAVALGDLDAAQTRQIAEFIEVGNYDYDGFKPEDAKKPALDKALILGGDDSTLSAAANASKWQAFARDLVNMPAADMYPESLAAKARELDKIDNVDVEVWDFETCRKKGLVGIIAVGQGSSKPGVLVHLTYRPPNAKDHIALVGKGVTFDSGGLSLKPSNFMQTMRCDMGGAATALAAFGAIAEAGLPIAVDAFLPSVENMCGANSYKLGDILRYRNGVTVEIHNTDAEGRLILADALILASEVEGVSRIVDMATLTGAVVVAIGPDYTGVFSHDDELAAEIQTASTAASEKTWRLPLDKAYNRMLKGTWGQIQNVGGREAGSITAGLFLDHFVPDDRRHVHLDIAGAAFADSANAPYAKGGTGQIVRTLLQWAEGLAE